MARFDKVDPKDGSFRVKLGFSAVAGDVGKVIPVDINGSGLAVKAAANSANCRGVICLTAPTPAGDPVDCMTDGEIVDVVAGTDVTGAVAGAEIKAGAAGTVDAAGTGKSIGFMVEAWRLIVRLGRVT
jgi:hypothetical protein